MSAPHSAETDAPEMRAFVAGWFAHARNPKDAPLLPEEAWHAYRLIEGAQRSTVAEMVGEIARQGQEITRLRLELARITPPEVTTS